MQSITASDFKARCLALMDFVNQSGEEILITKNGKPVSRLVPYRQKPPSLFGRGAGHLKSLGDLMQPLDVEWEALQ